ncbi:hypothetical protein QYE76_065429 [Lolium multiflorum]|uniref:Uncharacterized protein n=1 Tax=Lolium multiflorum TaxID=4521 RepID=A0AAD8S8V3_LOLMU|nr:hypothetical protein QYE76_065429 [Lolium multiflorum]
MYVKNVVVYVRPRWSLQDRRRSPLVSAPSAVSVLVASNKNAGLRHLQGHVLLRVHARQHRRASVTSVPPHRAEPHRHISDGTDEQLAYKTSNPRPINPSSPSFPAPPPHSLLVLLSCTNPFPSLPLAASPLCPSTGTSTSVLSKGQPASVPSMYVKNVVVYVRPRWSLQDRRRSPLVSAPSAVSVLVASNKNAGLRHLQGHVLLRVHARQHRRASVTSVPPHRAEPHRHISDGTDEQLAYKTSNPRPINPSSPSFPAPPPHSLLVLLSCTNPFPSLPLAASPLCPSTGTSTSVLSKGQPASVPSMYVKNVVVYVRPRWSLQDRRRSPLVSAPSAVSVLVASNKNAGLRHLQGHVLLRVHARQHRRASVTSVPPHRAEPHRHISDGTDEQLAYKTSNPRPINPSSPSFPAPPPHSLLVLLSCTNPFPSLPLAASPLCPSTGTSTSVLSKGQPASVPSMYVKNVVVYVRPRWSLQDRRRSPLVSAPSAVSVLVASNKNAGLRHLQGHVLLRVHARQHRRASVTSVPPGFRR